MSYMHTKVTTPLCISCSVWNALLAKVQLGKHHCMIQACSARHVTFTLDHTTCNMGCVKLSALLERVVLGGESKWMKWGEVRWPGGLRALSCTQTIAVAVKITE